MMLKKMKVVKYLAGHPAVDLSVKASDSRSTLMVATQSGVSLRLSSARESRFVTGEGLCYSVSGGLWAHGSAVL